MQINNLKIVHNFTHKVLLENFNLNVNKGDKIAIIGEEGNGKSSLLKAIYFEQVDYATITGTIKTSKRLGYLPQQISKEWLRNSVEEFFLKDNLEDEFNYERFNDFSIILRKFAEIGLDISFDRKLSTLSGGELIKIQIVKTLMNDSEILLLDEPTNDLDLSTINWMETYIKNLEIPVLFISHDETLLENTANVIIHIEQLKKKNESKHIVKKIDYKTYLNMRAAKIEHQEQMAYSERRDHKKQMDKFRHVYARVEHEQNVISRGDPSGARLLAKKMKALKSQEKRFDEKEFTDIPIVEEAIYIEFNDGCFIPNKRVVVDLSLPSLSVGEKKLSKNINLSIVGNEKIVIIGKNGVGKSTLLKKIISDMEERSLKVGYFPQNYSDIVDFKMTAIQWLKQQTKIEESIIRSHMGSVRFTREEMGKKIEDYSGGQIAKLCLLRLILLGSNVLVLDEPTRNFSPLSNPVFRKALIDYLGCIIAVSHDRKFISEVASKVYELTNISLNKM